MRLFLHRRLTQLRRRWHLKLAQAHTTAPKKTLRQSLKQSTSWPSCALIISALALLISGPVLFNWHVQHLAEQLPTADKHTPLPAWQTILPGLRFLVPAQSKIQWLPHAEGGLWIMAGMKEEAPVNIDLCRQQADARHWIPITIGTPFADIVQRVRRNQARQIPDAAGLKTVVLSDEAGPQIEATAVLEDAASQTLGWRLRISAAQFQTGLLSDADPAQMQQTGGPSAPQSTLHNMKKEAWLHWIGSDGPRALHLQQRGSAVGSRCEYGQLQLQWYRAGKASGRAWVQPFTWQQGALPRAYLAAGSYHVPALAVPPLEDQQLFEDLLQNGLLRLSQADSASTTPAKIELIPREALSTPKTATTPTGWPDIRTHPQRKRLWQRLYTGADGAYVRQQIQVFNREQAASTASTASTSSTSSTRLGDQAYRHIKLVNSAKPGTATELALQWQTVRRSSTAAAVAAQAPGQGAEVSIQDRQGRALWANGQISPEAKQAGLGGLLLDPAEGGHSLPAMLARANLGPNAHPQPNVQLTLDLPLQTLAQKILECIAMQQGKWDGQNCNLPVGGSNTPPPAARRAAFILQDTETGEIMASAQAGTGTQTLLPWQHDGSSHASPGSTFKVVTALGLEMAARQQPRLQSLLAGLPLNELNRIASQQGYAFHSNAACYPMPCDGKQPHLSNYKDHILASKAQAGQFGLVQALSSSMNTWFAWNSEFTDASLLGQASGGLPDVQALQANTLEPLRPILAAAHQLGFEQVMRLDGGLLPPQFAWQAGDVLQSTPAHIDVSHSRHELRQIALGLRMQSHALQMAQVAAAIAQGEIHPPRLIRQMTLAGATKTSANIPPEPKKPLTPRLDRIRAGMQDVVQHGTAAQAFAGPELQALRPFLYGKTGTAPADENNNSAWFIAWLEPGQLPAQTNAHRWAFAVYVSHTDLTGGAHAAPVVAGLLRSLVAKPAPSLPQSSARIASTHSPTPISSVR